VTSGTTKLEGPVPCTPGFWSLRQGSAGPCCPAAEGPGPEGLRHSPQGSALQGGSLNLSPIAQGLPFEGEPQVMKWKLL
jgi:hypothetical protein